MTNPNTGQVAGDPCHQPHHAPSNPAPVGAGAGGRRFLFTAAAASLLTAKVGRAAAWREPHAYVGSPAEQAFCRCLSMIHLHNRTIGALMDVDAPDAEIEVVLRKIDTELELAASVVPDTRHAFALKALIVHRHAGGGVGAGDRVAAALLSELMSNGGAA